MHYYLLITPRQVVAAIHMTNGPPSEDSNKAPSTRQKYKHAFEAFIHTGRAKSLQNVKGTSSKPGYCNINPILEGDLSNDGQVRVI